MFAYGGTARELLAGCLSLCVTVTTKVLVLKTPDGSRGIPPAKAELASMLICWFRD